MIYNNTNKLDRLLSNGHQLLSNLGHSRAKIGRRVLFDNVHMSAHLLCWVCLAIVGSDGVVHGRNGRIQIGRGEAEAIQTLRLGFPGGG
jgi:hypothetical protein